LGERKASGKDREKEDFTLDMKMLSVRRSGAGKKFGTNSARGFKKRKGESENRGRQETGNTGAQDKLRNRS